MLELEALSMLIMDATRGGGVSKVRKLAVMAEARQVANGAQCFISTVPRKISTVPRKGARLRVRNIKDRRPEHPQGFKACRQRQACRNGKACFLW